jgi:hypothetical protein
MLYTHSYKARVENNTITWPEGKPPELQDGREHDVLVILPENSEEKFRRSQQLANILKNLSKLDPFRDIEDPVEWQREIRKDRPLPGRE